MQQSWRLLRTDPLLGTTRADLNRLPDYMTVSVETTLIALVRWIAEHPAEAPLVRSWTRVRVFPCRASESACP